MRFVLVIALTLASLVVVPDPAVAQEDDESPVTITEVDQPVGGIIPQPNSGRAPEDPGDRGGALQLTVLGLIVVFAGFAVFAVRRSSRRALAAQGRT